MEKKERKPGQSRRGLDTVGKRILVLTLAILMTFQFCTPTLSGVSFAEELTEADVAELAAQSDDLAEAEATEGEQETVEAQEEAAETEPPVVEEQPEAAEGGDVPSVVETAQEETSLAVNDPADADKAAALP